MPGRSKTVANCDPVNGGGKKAGALTTRIPSSASYGGFGHSGLMTDHLRQVPRIVRKKEFQLARDGQWQAKAVTASIIFVLAVTFILLAGYSEPDLLPGLPAVAGQQ